MIAFIQIFSSVVNQINDLALENGINRETVKSLRDRARRFKTQVEKEAQVQLESDPDFDAINYIHQRAKEVGLNQEKVEDLIGKMGWLKTKKDAIKASKGNIEKLNAVRKHHPKDATITSKELDEVSEAEGLATIWFIKDNFGTGERGIYYIPDLVNGEFVKPDANSEPGNAEE